jgi:hydrogenase/urease accessory protein HupE
MQGLLRAHFLLRFVLAALFVFSVARTAAAHDPFELTTVGRLTPTELTLVTTSTRGCALALTDPRRPRGASFAPEELPRLTPSLEVAGRNLFELTQHGVRILPLSVKAELTVEQELQLTVVYPAPNAGPLQVLARHVQTLGIDYANAFTLTQERPAAVLGAAVFTSDAAQLSVDVLDRVAPSATPPLGSSGKAHISFGRTFVLGIEHILAGYDHLLFLAGLLIACRRARAMAAIVTAFTLAHSITLALAALDVVSFPASLVEPLIAASIVLVGVENLLLKHAPPARTALCFGFGLVHGFGFAGALRELGLGQNGAPIALPLLGFNLGVEAGQLLVVAVLLPLLLCLRKSPALSRIALPAASLAVAVAGAWWLVDRTLLSSVSPAEARGAAPTRCVLDHRSWKAISQSVT